MRYEDASATDFNADQALAPSLNANGDVDVILAGQYGPATGNAITGTGTISGIAGADMVGAGASITAIQGAGGTDTSFSGGKLQVAGEHGVLTIDAQGNYSYVRNQGSPNGVSDVFTYTLAGRDGDTDLATLTINIGKTPTVVQANAVQVVPGPDGVVTLPPGVELSDIHVVGRNLVIDMPDGTQMIIIDGAVFVPQLVLGTVEVPSTNLAALLIDSEPTPAAGPPQSSGGNFAVPVAPLDPGVPLGDLIPPTELAFTPPTFEEVAQPVEEEDEIVLITDLTPAVSGGDVIVDEDDLSDGSDTSKESLTVAGTFTLIAPDGVDSLTVGSLSVIANGNFQAGATLTTPLGNTLTITGYNAATGVVSYSYTLGDNEAHASGAGENSLFEDFLVTLTDEDGDVDTDTLSVNIVDDIPTANNDTAGLLEGGATSVTVDVDTNDVPGADGTASRVFASLTGTYGNLVLNADGTQTYSLSAAGIAAIDALAQGATLTDTFNYTLTDSDGDSDPATLVVTLTGTDDPPLITNLTPSANGGEAIVDEDDLSDGSDTVKESLTVTGDFTISAPDGVDDLTVGGVNVIVNGVFQAGASGLSPLGNQITFTGYNAATGVVSYSYTLLDNEAHPAGNGENSLFDNMTVTLTDNDGDVDTDALSIQIVDDVPTANDDAFSILEGDADNAISFDVDLNDVPGADGTASRTFTSLAGTYGNLTLNGDGTQTYTLNAVGIAAINALPPGATLADNFSYTLTDGDGDSDPATLVITLTGTDDPPVITGLTPSANGGDAIVDEDDLPDGSDTVKESLTVTGDFTISAPDGVDDLTVNGINVIVNGVFQVGATGATPLGNTITFTGYNAATGVVSYSYTLLDNETHANANGENSLFDNMTVSLTDTDNDLATGTLSVQIVDDVPTANDDAFSIFEGDADNAITFDVDLNDVPGADGTASRNFTSLVGTYGNLTLNGDGTQTYTLNAAGVLAINALAPGATLQDNFSYTLTDTDGDADPANLVITLTGVDDPPVITGLNPSAQGGDAIVDEDDLPDGSDTSKESLTVNGDFTISAPDGVNDLTVGGINVIVDGVFQVGATGATPLGNTITFTSYNAVTGVVSYSYTLLDNETHANANGENSLFDDMAVVLTDTDNDIANGTLSVQIVDDVPTANDDAFTIFEGDADNAITFDVDLNDVPGADGTASRIFASLTGTYGNLTINGDGTQTYTLNAAGVLAINALAPGATLQDNFTYTLTDTDGDADPATLVITLSGTDDPPVITNLTPSAQGGDAIVDEDDLPDGSDTSKESLTVNGDFTISAPDGINDLTVNGINVFIDGVFQAGATGGTPLGNTITFTGYNAATGVVSYSYTLLDNEAHANANGENSLFDDMAVVLTDTDNDIANGTLSVQIVDDVPTANDDAFTIFEGDADNAITFDVDLNDVPGADGTASRIFTSLTGTYGNLVVNGDGTQTYTLNAAGVLAINALAPGATLQDNFTYTLTDGDGDADPATLVITLSGTDDPPVITNLTPSAQGGDAIVDEDDLADGSDTVKESTTVTGDFTISAPDGINDLTVNGINVFIDGVFQVGATGATPLGNTITFTGFNAATGVVSYSYTLLDNESHANANGENSLFDDMAVVLTDTDNDIANATLSVQIVDDVPTANDDAFTIFEGDADNAITFDVDLNDVPGADGTASRNFTSLVGTYGNLTVNGDGTQTYTLNAAGVLALNALGNGATLQDNFSYTLTDGDGDSDPANLVITLQGTDDPVLITNLTPSAQGGDVIVDEDDLADGSDTSKESLTVNGDFTISAPDGVNDLTVGGFDVIIDGVFQPGSHVTPLGNTLTFISYNAGTGVVSYSYTLVDNETHPNANGENSIFEDFAVILTDTDNDVDTDTLSVQIVDDVPTANDDAASQGAENSPVVVNVISNDVQGADGVDVDNNPAVRVELVAGTLTGAGGLVYNNNGTFTYTPAPGEEGIVTFDYRITDGDGDSDTATVTITLDADSVPIVSAAVASVDDDGLTGGNPASVTGDLAVPNTDGDNNESTFTGTFVTNFGGDTGTFSLAAMHGTSGSVGTETVNYTYAGNMLTATGPRGVLFTVTVNPTTGQYDVALLDNVLHVAGSDENDATAALTFTATDSDGDAVNGTLTVTFDDDAPTAVAAKTVTMSNAAGSGSNFLDADNDVDNNLGADGGKVIFTAASITALQAQNLTSGLSALNYSISPDGTVLTATKVSDASTVFMISLQPVGSPDQYVVTVVQPLDAFEDVSFSDGGYDFVGGNGAWAGFLIAGNNDSQDLLLTPEVGNANASTINSSAISGGVGSGNSVGANETFRVDFVTDLTGDPGGSGGYETAGNRDHAFEGHYNTNGASAIFTATAGSTVKITAYQDADGNNVVGDGTIDGITQIIISYDGVSSGLITVTSTPTNYLVNGNTYTVTLNPDGSVNVGGVVGTSGAGAIGTKIAVFTDTVGVADANPGYNSLEFSYVSGDTFKIGDFGAITISEDPVNFTVPISVEDGDGDIVSSGNLNISLTPPVVLDMDGDGVEFLDRSAGVAYDYNGDGVAEATGWAGADDAILVRDANGNGTVDDASEFVFGGNGVTDLEALAAQYGDTLDANDADFASFKVWQDANSNGTVDEGELISLTDAGIASISLVSNSVAYSAANGDVEVAGTGSFTWADGSTGSLADAAFVTEQRNAANTNTAMIAALAAAGMAAAPAAAQPADLASASAVAIAASLVASNGSAIDRNDDVSRPGLGNETKEAVVDESAAASSSASSSGNQAAGGNSLTADSGPSPDSQPLDLLGATDAQASISVDSIVAPMVSMPSAQALIAASLNGNAADGSQSNAVVGKVLADALEGGGADASVDALLNALPAQGLGGNAAVEALASQPGAAVSAWDMGHSGGLSANANFTMEAMALHHDAVQSVANG